MHIVVEGKTLREALSRSGPVATRATGHGTEMYSSVKTKVALTLSSTRPGKGTD